uniref:Uncharacterized protein n=1 Tax=Meloidogyne incognita TaxID=6306 RepID=A0A914M4U3_MELIC
MSRQASMSRQSFGLTEFCQDKVLEDRLLPLTAHAKFWFGRSSVWSKSRKTDFCL